MWKFTKYAVYKVRKLNKIFYAFLVAVNSLHQTSTREGQYNYYIYCCNIS